MALKGDIKLFRTVLAIGILLVFAGLSYIIILPSHRTEGFLFVLIAFMLIGAVIVYFSLVLKKSIFLYVGLNIFIIATTACFIFSSKQNQGFIRYWPLLLISFGITMLPCCYFRYNRLRSLYVVPSIFLVVLGTVFFLFALKVIPISFKQFVIYMWPILFLCAGGILIAYYFYGIYNKNNLIEEIEETEIDDITILFSGEEELYEE